MVAVVQVLLTLTVLQCATVAEHNSVEGRVSVGVFHPYSAAGGGGERVLWCAVNTILNR